MKILGIETTCDETGISIIEFDHDKFRILSNELRYQFNIHKKYGGIVPILAAREHKKNLEILYKEVFKKSKLKEKDIDYIAFAYGPGLPPALVEGKLFTQKVAKKINRKIIPVNHLLAHFYSVLIPKNKINIWQKIKKIDFPSLGLLVSGGHTILVYIKDFNNIKTLGETLDDAIGESLDKAGRLLGLDYPGGPKLEKLAKNGRAIFNLPRPMIGVGNYNFSFSGLKTAFLELIEEIKKYNKFDEDAKKDLAKSYQKAAFESLLIKTKKAYDRFKAKNIIICGGVSANQELIKMFKKVLSPQKIIYPVKSLATDNGAKIAFTGYFFLDKAINYKDLDIDPNLKI